MQLLFKLLSKIRGKSVSHPGSDRPGFNQFIDQDGQSTYLPNFKGIGGCVFDNCTILAPADDGEMVEIPLNSRTFKEWLL